jgi:uncharacterized membrane protein
MMMTNTWDVAIYSLVLFVLGMQILLNDPREIKKLLGSAGVMIISMILVALPWWLSFKSISNGIGLVNQMSPFWQLLVLWGGGMIVSIVAVLTEGKGEQKMVIRTLALSVVMLIIIPEIIFARDIYPNHPRANTMFKLTYQAFIMMGILLGAGIGKLVDRERKISLKWRVPALFLVFWIFVGTMNFPLMAYPTYYGSFAIYYGLGGMGWMISKFPENYGAVVYLQDHRDGKNMVEAVGDSYTLMNSVSVFSGVPTIEGWRVHEWLWRGGYGPVASREAEVREVYQGVDVKKTLTILQKYNIGWIFVGQDERITYKVNEEKLWKLGDVVWKLNESYLIKVN